MQNDCTLLVNSYDGGEDLWEGFFTALKVQWPEFNMPIVLNTESKEYSFPGFEIKTFSLYQKGARVPWGKRLRETLKRIDTEYVLFFLEDFWLDAPVDVEHFEKCRQWMRDNADVATISFQRTRGNNIKDGRFDRFEKRPQKGPYRMNCQAALWRKDKLYAFVRSHESPWEWEEYGSKRSSRNKESLYTLIENAPKVFSYNLSMGGVLHRGRWCKEVVLPLKELYGLNIDFTKRGFHENWVAENHKRKRNLWRGIKNRINKLRSLI